MQSSSEFEDLTIQHKDAVYRQLLRLTHNREDAEDILIEALLTAYRHREELRSPAAFQAWLAQIARRVYHRMRKRQALHPFFALDAHPHEAALLPSTERAPDDVAATEEFERRFREAIDHLPEKHRIIYVRHELDGLTAKEIGEDLKLSLPAVKSRLHRSREIVREYLDRHLHESAG